MLISEFIVLENRSKTSQGCHKDKCHDLRDKVNIYLEDADKQESLTTFKMADTYVVGLRIDILEVARRELVYQLNHLKTNQCCQNKGINFLMVEASSKQWRSSRISKQTICKSCYLLCIPQ